MTKRLSLAERLAADDKNLLLDEIVKQDDWSLFLVQQAVLHFGLRKPEFSCNDLRDVLPELGHGFLGAAINALRTAGIIAHTDRMVPSTQANTHGHRIAVWKLTGKGIGIAARSAAARRDQRKAA
ncbi:hypothetical protein PV733_31740 [Streptomyces europaeiscabiei]|uniref:hypothetical protein n=1 Tax=Streptomyces europaeiscabiei TaxID=146819 RepID=UPI0029B89F5B|nr:hypothetical protein [Streptomyces europaeiscabiei]MDX3713437.1 hypothetical protein [Streptomyces europaeiscabiei]